MFDVDRSCSGLRSRPHPDAIIARLAEAQGGAVGRRQLREQGLTRNEIEHRLATGHLHPLHRGVYAAGAPTVGAPGRRHAALLAVGPDAALSHRSAAAAWDLWQDNRPTVDVTVARSVRRRTGIRVHRARLHPDDVAIRDGLRITSVARTVLDLAADVDERTLLRLLERADRLQLLDARALHDACTRANGHHGVGRLRRALDAYDPRHGRTRSHLERRVQSWIERHGIPRPEFNVQVGPYTVDLLWRAQRLVVEIDGWDTHRTRAAFERDRERDRRLARMGLRCVRLTARQLDDRATASDILALTRSPA